MSDNHVTAALARSLTAHAVATSRLGAAVRDAQQQPQRRRWWRWGR